MKQIDFHTIPLCDDVALVSLGVVMLAELAGLIHHSSKGREANDRPLVLKEIQDNYGRLFSNEATHFPLPQAEMDLIADCATKNATFHLAPGHDRDEIDLGVLHARLGNLVNLAIYRGGDTQTQKAISATLGHLRLSQVRRTQP